MDVDTIQAKLAQGVYPLIDDVALDVRRMLSNALRFSFLPDKVSAQFRKGVRDVLYKFEGRWLDWNKLAFPSVILSPPCLELRACLSALEEVFRAQSSGPLGGSAAASFIDPVSVLFQGEALRIYLAEVCNIPPITRTLTYLPTYLLTKLLT